MFSFSKLLSLITSDVGPLFGMTGQIPTRLISGLREKRVRAGLGLRRIEHVFGLAALFADCEVVIDDDRSIGVPIRRHADAEDGEIDDKSEGNDGQQRENCEDGPSSQAHAERRCRSGIH